MRKIDPDLVNLQLESRAPATVQKYKSGWLKWRGWAASKIGVQVIPAKPLHIALFISELTKISVKGVSYTTLREEFRNYVRPFVDDIANYGTHSIKSGAASNPACRSVYGDLLDMHTGWNCASTKSRYIKHTVSDRLKVAKSIAL